MTSMTSNTRVPKSEITGIYGCLLKKMMRKMLGAVPEGAEVMWHYPAVFKDLMGFGRKADKWDRLDPNLASFAAMAAAGTVGCSFCLDLGYFMAHKMAHQRGLDAAKAREVPRWRRGGGAVAARRQRRQRRERAETELLRAVLGAHSPAAMQLPAHRAALVRQAAVAIRIRWER